MPRIVTAQSVLLIALVCALVSCGDKQPPITQDQLMGTYIYKSDDPDDRPTDHNLDRLVLGRDGSYDLVQGGTTKPKSETRGHWGVVSEPDGTHLRLDHSGYPVLVKGGDIRLMIDTDTGIWYQKTK